MLVLSRRKGESIFITDKIKVTIIEIRGDKVRLGIEAAKDVPIYREEVWLAVQREKGASE